jgi:hypothetical protein
MGGLSKSDHRARAYGPAALPLRRIKQRASSG